MTPTITLIDTTRLKPNPNNPRKNIGDITALADSIRAHGIQQELVVTPIADSTDYRVVIGHRRLAGSLIEVMKEGDDHDDDNDAE